MFSAITTGTPEPEDALGDEAVAAADPLPSVQDDDGGVDVLERRVHRALHVLRQRIEWALEPGEVDEDELVVVAVHDPPNPAPRGLRLVGHDRHLPPAERVHERRLPDVRTPRDGDEPALHGATWKRTSVTSAPSAAP